MSGVYYADLTAFVEQLEAASGQSAEDMALNVVHQMADSVAELGRRYAPVDTGELRASIASYKGPQTTSIRAEAPHAAYVEFGTWQFNTFAPKMGTYDITPRKPGGSLRFVNASGKTVFTNKVQHPGIKAQPYMGPAAEETVEKFVNGIASVGVQLIVEGA